MEEKRVTSNTIIPPGLMRLAAEQLNKDSVKGAENATRLAILGNIPHSGADESHNTNNRDPLTKKPKSTTASVVVNIQSGQPSPAQKQAWGRFWQKIIIEVKKETGE